MTRSQASSRYASIADLGPDAQRVTAATLAIPLPPSLNNIFVNLPRGGRAKSPEYKAWRQLATLQINTQHPGRIVGDVRIEITCERPNKASDLDNRIKPVLDAIVTARVIEDDRKVVELTAKWGDVRGVLVNVEVA